MRAYLVSSPGGNGEPPRDIYAGTQAESRALRDQLMDEAGLPKSKVKIEEVDIPTSKAELLAFVNGLTARIAAAHGNGGNGGNDDD